MPQGSQQKAQNGSSSFAEPSVVADPKPAEGQKKTTIFEEFDGLTEKKEEKPVIFFFYIQPTSAKEQRSKAVLNANMFGRLLAHAKVAPLLSEFNTYKRSFRTTSKKILKKYRITTAPMLVIFDATGKVKLRITNPKMKPQSLAAKLKAVLKISEKAVEKAQKKRERDAEKKAKKAEASAKKEDEDKEK